MTIPAHDQDAALELLIDGYKALRAKDDTHELLGYFSDFDNGVINKDRQEEFFERFGYGHAPMTIVRTRYYVALENAAGQVDDRANGAYELAEDIPLLLGDMKTHY